MDASPTPSHLSHFLAFAHTLADAAGAAIRPYFEQVKAGSLTVDAKADDSPVTAADRAAESAMRALIAQHFRDHAIYGEEFGQQIVGNLRSALRREPLAAEGQRSEGNKEFPSIKNYTWLLDPIDGTRAFIAGRKEWGTLIALCENGVPILGILDQPITSERWVGVQGQPTLYFTNHEPRTTSHEISTRACPSLGDATISTTSHRYFTPEQAMAFAKLAEQCGEVVEDGDCYAYGMLARGERDIVVDAGLKPYDILALVPIIEGAGGRITTWDGASVTLSNYKDVVAVGDVGLAITL
jgi:fructose-1,6-bisphosphatase/inositol monophosphatase family enzyme